jgi:hypothetical protein
MRTKELTNVQHSIHLFLNTMVRNSLKSHFERYGNFNANYSAMSKFDADNVNSHSIQIYDATKSDQEVCVSCFFTTENKVAELFKKHNLVPSFLVRFMNLQRTDDFNFDSPRDMYEVLTFHPQLTPNKVKWSDKKYQSFYKELCALSSAVGIKPICG